MSEDGGRRAPRNDLDSEAAVLAACLLKPGAIDEVRGLLDREHFYSESNGRIYEAILAVADAGGPVDIITTAAWLRDRERLHKIGGSAYIAQLADATPDAHHVEGHARIVFAKWRQRQMGAAGHRLAAESYGDVGDLDEWIAKAEAEIRSLSDGGKAPAGEMLFDVLQSLFHKQSVDPTATSGYRTRTGYTDYDKKTAGSKGGRVTAVAGRPGSGKSSWSRGAAVGVAKNAVGERPGVVMFSLEMPKEQVAIGMLCAEASVDSRRWEEGLLLPAEWSALSAAAERIGHLGIIIDDTPSLSLADLRANLVKYIKQYNAPATATTPERKIRVVVVDYLQLMKGSGKKGQSREQEISEITRGLKVLAKEFDVWVIELAQMNRDAEKQKREPVLSDLRESGGIEADADEVTFIHQPYDESDDEGKKGRGKTEEPRLPDGRCKVIIRKQRGGPTCTVEMQWFPQFTRFADVPPDESRYHAG